MEHGCMYSKAQGVERLSGEDAIGRQRTLQADIYIYIYIYICIATHHHHRDGRLLGAIALLSFREPHYRKCQATGPAVVLFLLCWRSLERSLSVRALAPKGTGSVRQSRRVVQRTARRRRGSVVLEKNSLTLGSLSPVAPSATVPSYTPASSATNYCTRTRVRGYYARTVLVQASAKD